MTGLHDSPAAAYSVLKSERWVRRQHHGRAGVHHARFMQPYCQAFPGAPRGKSAALHRFSPVELATTTD